MKQEKNIQSEKERRLKVQPKYFDRATTAYPTIFPEIRLCGKWLLDSGFEHGQTVKVKQEMNKITITVVHENQTEE